MSLWLHDDKLEQISLLKVPNYNAVHNIRTAIQKEGGRNFSYAHDTLDFKTLRGLNKNNVNIKGITIKIILKNQKNLNSVCSVQITTWQF